MAKHKRKTFFALGVLALVGSFSAGSDAPFPGLSYRYGPVVKGEPLAIHAEYSDREYPVYEIQIRLYTSNDKSTLLYTGNLVNGKLTDAYPIFYFDQEIPAYYTENYNSMYLDITFRYKEDWWWVGYHDGYLGWNIKEVGDSVSVMNPALNATYDTKRRTLIRDLGEYSSHLETDSYYIGKWDLYPESSSYHGLGIQNFVLGYHGGSSGGNSLLGYAYLSIFTHPEEWTIGTQTTYQGNRCVIIPLRLVEQSTYVDEETGYSYQMYNVETATTYWVSRLDYSMSTYAPNKTSYFQSNDVFLPIRNGYEDEPFLCYLTYTYLSSYSDTFYVGFTASKGTKLFGNCEDADYCVTLG